SSSRGASPPGRDGVGEAAYSAKPLAESDIPVEGLIVNRVHPAFGDERVEGLRARADTLAAKRSESVRAAGDGAVSARRLAELYTNLADFRPGAECERHHVAGGKAPGGRAAVAFVPYLSRDVYDFDALAEVGRHLFTTTPTAPARAPYPSRSGRASGGTAAVDGPRGAGA